jgi:lipopolysaccharide export system protein LptA
LRTIIPVLLLLAPALPAAEDVVIAPRKKLSAVSLLPDGSKLHGVIYPRYDNQHHLLNVLKAREITLVTTDTFSGETVSIEFFGGNGSPNGRMDLVRALCDQTKGTLETREPVTLQSDRINARGTGLYYTINRGEGYLLGPATTWILPNTATTMNSSQSPISTVATVGMSLLTQPLAATPPPAVTPQEVASLHADAASREPLASGAATLVRADLAKDRGDAAVAAVAAKQFVAQADLPLTGAEPAVAAAKPLDMKPGPNDTVISCDGGMYFDADAGLFVYFKNVRVTDPQFTLTGANELKIFLSPKPADNTPKEDKKESSSLGLGAKFGDVERIVASGAVHIVQKQPEPGKQPIEASGAFFTYHTQTGQIILSGGYPWVKQGTTFMRAKEPNLNLRVLKTGSFVTEGNWDMSGQLDRK